jgi:hypothetical protein
MKSPEVHVLNLAVGNHSPRQLQGGDEAMDKGAHMPDGR